MKYKLISLKKFVQEWRCLVFLIGFILYSVLSFGQTPPADSIFLAFDKMADDSAKVNQLIIQSHQFEEKRQFVPGLTLNNEALVLGEKLNINKTMQEEWLQMAFIAHANGLVSEEKKYLRLSNDSPANPNSIRMSQRTAIENDSIKINRLVKNSASNFSVQSDLKKLEQQNLQLAKRLDTLVAAEKEYRRRITSFGSNAEDQFNRDVENLSLQQRILTEQAEAATARRNYAIFGGLILAALLTIVFIQVYRRRQTKHSLETNQLKNKFLRAQLNPHFIFNALNSIRNYIQKHPAIADNYLTKFSILMRQVLENSEEEKITLEEEISMLENYMQLESILMLHGFDYEVSLDESADAANTMVPPLIFQPMIENAIIHGLKPLNKRGKIHLLFSENNGLLQATIEDNGVGQFSTTVATTGIEKKRSMGMQITRERIALMNRKSKLKGWLEQELNEAGSNVKIAIPV